MIQIPFQLRPTKPHPPCFVGPPPVSEVKLNDEWKIEYTWIELHRNSIISYSPQHIKFIRQTTSEEILISGILTYKSQGKEISTSDFSRLIPRGSSSILIYLRDVHPSSPHSSVQLGYFITDGIVYISSTRKEEEKEKKCIQVNSLEELSHDFEKLLNPITSCYSDVILKCGGEKIPAHKYILSARSPEFAEKLKENCVNSVDVDDLDPSVLRAMLAFIYTGKTSNLTVSSASDLLHAAHAYKLKGLKRECSDLLKENVSQDNVLWLLTLGDEYSEDLKSSAVDYFCNKTDVAEIQKTEEWKTLSAQKPSLMIHALTCALITRCLKTTTRY